MQQGSFLSQYTSNQEQFHMPSMSVKQEFQEIQEIIQQQRKASPRTDLNNSLDYPLAIEDFFKSISVTQGIKGQTNTLFQKGNYLGIATDHAVTITVQDVNLPNDSWKYSISLIKSSDPKTPLDFNGGKASSPLRVKTKEFNFHKNQAKMKVHLKCLEDMPRENHSRDGVCFRFIISYQGVSQIELTSVPFHCWSNPATLYANCEKYYPRIETVQLKRGRDDVYYPRKVAKLEIKNEYVYQQPETFPIDSAKKEELQSDPEEESQCQYLFNFCEDEPQESQCEVAEFSDLRRQFPLLYESQDEEECEEECTIDLCDEFLNNY